MGTRRDVRVLHSLTRLPGSTCASKWDSGMPSTNRRREIPVLFGAVPIMQALRQRGIPRSAALPYSDRRKFNRSCCAELPSALNELITELASDPWLECA
jgi:hypothetical protein